MSGKTDPQIVREYLALVESDDPSHLPAVLEHLRAGTGRRRRADRRRRRNLPGSARPSLSALSADDRLHLSVLTGNIAPNAVVKLAAFGLEKWLDLEAGAYGSDHEDRATSCP